MLSIPFNRATSPSLPFTLKTTSPQANGLAMWLPLLNTRGAGRLFDLASGNSLAYVGNAWVTDGQMAAGVSFPGSSSGYAQGSNAIGLTFNDALTIAAWVKPTTLTTADLVLVGTSSPARGWGMYMTSGGALGFLKTGVVAVSSAAAIVAAGTLTHIALSYNGTSGEIRYYKNGQYVESQTNGAAFSAPAATDTITLGIWYALNADYQNGATYEARIYHRVLTDAEVLSLWLPQTRWDLYQPLLPTAYKAPAVAVYTPRLTLLGVG